jgi:hypothetical protein
MSARGDFIIGEAFGGDEPGGEVTGASNKEGLSGKLKTGRGGMSLRSMGSILIERGEAGRRAQPADRVLIRFLDR